MLGNDGDSLSRGQRQLISIARAQLAGRSILVLDEATSSVDSRTEVQIRQAMQRLRQGSTSFVIAHRLSTVRDADLILVMDHGRIVEQGTHQQTPGQERAYPDCTAPSSPAANTRAASRSPDSEPGTGTSGTPVSRGRGGPTRPAPCPLFEQLRLHIIERADNGTLAPGTKLPAVRSLAGELGVAPHTVARAYKELEAAGVVATRGRNGTVVCARDERLELALRRRRRVRRRRQSAGCQFAEAVQLLAAAYDRE